MASKPAPLTLEVFKAAHGQPGIKQCKVAEWLKTLPAPERASVFAAYADPTVQTSAIHRVLQARGFGGSRETVARSRQGQCPQCEALRGGKT